MIEQLDYLPLDLDEEILIHNFETIVKKAGYSCGYPNYRSPDHEHSARNEYNSKALGHGAAVSHATLNETSMIWHRDGIRGCMALWSNVAPTEIKSDEGFKFYVDPGHVVIFNNEHYEHRMPPDITWEDAKKRHFIRAVAVPYSQPKS